jgi:Flp pilus assembly pilin Flp
MDSAMESSSWWASARNIRRQIAAYAADESGATAIEYALIAATLTVALTVILYSIRDEEAQTYETLASSFEMILSQ